MKFFNEIDLGSDFSGSCEYDDSPKAYSARQKMIASAFAKNYIVVERHNIVHVFNLEAFKSIGINISRNED